MQVILNPVSHPELGKIVIEEQLFPIGRGEEPFVSYDPAIAAHLSRRHARIFREDQGIYVADLGSRNGTRLNSKPVEFKPYRLLTGDRLSLAGLLDYEVEIRSESGDPQTGASAGLALTLLPVEEASALDALVVSHFPYLIGKSDPAFAGAGNDDTDRRGFLSRRHAHIFARGGRLFIEDLASTNGTCLNGKRLDEHAHALSDGDVLLFGGDYFSYRVKLQASAQRSGEPGASAPPGVPVDTAADECHTTYVASANSFLDIFCVEADEEASPAPEQEAAAEVINDSKSISGGTVRPGLFSRLTTFSKELKSAFADGQGQRNGKARWIALGAVALAGVLAVGLFYSGKARHDVENLLAQKRYGQAAELASVQLAADPGQEVMTELATEALAKLVLTGWLERVQEGDYAGAQASIASARPLTANNPGAGELLDVLEWVTGLQQFVSERGGLEAPVEMYGQKERIESLLAWWNGNPEEYRGRMALLLNYVPEFKALHDQAFSQLRTLRYEKSVYLPAIEKLDAAVNRQLALDQPGELPAQIDAMGTQYPRLGGLDRLRVDLQNYLAVQAALTQGDRVRAAALIERSEFSSPPFREKAASLLTTLLPSEAAARQLSEASQAWRDGKLVSALDLLAQAADQKGGELAAQELASKRQIIAGYARLQDMRDDASYGERLVKFYSGLDPIEDVHFTGALSQDFQRYREAALLRADRAWERAAASWDRYRNDGGIRGILRLEEQVSARFGEQARLLSQAQSSANYAQQVYTLLGKESSPQQVELHQQIGAEMTLQRRSLQQLSMVLSPEVLDTKLGLLALAPDDAEARLN